MEEKVRLLKTKSGRLRLPAFFPDATLGAVRTLGTEDLERSKTPGVLVNTYHLYRLLPQGVLERFGSIGEFMGWQGAVISDSGGFQIMSLVKRPGGKGKVSDKGVCFRTDEGERVFFTPEESVRFQLKLKPDIMVVLDEFTPPSASYGEAEETVRRTVAWARRCKKEFEKRVGGGWRPYLIAVVQGGRYADLRKSCARELKKIGFDGFGYGGWPLKESGRFDYKTAELIAKEAPKNYLLYGLGIGKPEEIVTCVKLGYHLFDCVLPTRDARHKRLYVFNASTQEEIDLSQPEFYSFLNIGRAEYLKDKRRVSKACDCLLCQRYSRAYLAYLFRVKEVAAKRLATIHNLRFYSLLMEKLQETF